MQNLSRNNIFQTAWRYLVCSISYSYQKITFFAGASIHVQYCSIVTERMQCLCAMLVSLGLPHTQSSDKNSLHVNSHEFVWIHENSHEFTWIHVNSCESEFLWIIVNYLLCFNCAVLYKISLWSASPWWQHSEAKRPSGGRKKPKRLLEDTGWQTQATS